MKKSIEQLLRSVKNEPSLGKLTVEAEDSSWLKIQKEIDMISAPAAAPSIFDVLRAPFHSIELRAIMQPVSVFGLVIALSTGWVGSVFASMNSVPGDTLYGLKIVAERAQLTLANSDDMRARLHIEFANRRADEVSRLLEKQVPNREARIKTAIGNLKTELQSVSAHLSNSKDSEGVVALAKLVDRKVGALESAIDSNLAGATDSVKQEAEQVRDVIKVASDQSLTLLVQDAKTPETLEVVEKKVTARLTEVTTSIRSTGLAVKTLQTVFAERVSRLPILSEADRKLADEFISMSRVLSEADEQLQATSELLAAKDYITVMKIAQAASEAVGKMGPRIEAVRQNMPDIPEPPATEEPAASEEEIAESETTEESEEESSSTVTPTN